MARCLSWCVVFSVCFLAGCGKSAPLIPDREATSPVSGVLHVDGSPAAGVEVAFHPQDANAKIKYQITTTTDKDGKFSATTYESGDGLPAGEYKVTFTWMEGLTTQKDRLKGKFKNAKKSQHSVLVEGTEGEKVDMGTIELKTK